MTKDRLFETMSKAVIDGLLDKARDLAEEALKAGLEPLEAIDRGFKPGMDIVGEALPTVSSSSPT